MTENTRPDKKSSTEKGMDVQAAASIFRVQDVIEKLSEAKRKEDVYILQRL